MGTDTLIYYTKINIGGEKDPPQDFIEEAIDFYVIKN